MHTFTHPHTGHPRRSVQAAWLLAGTLSASVSASPVNCGFQTNPVPQLKPQLASLQGFIASDPGVDCLMWQTFVYLNWPALPGQRGVPNPKVMLGSPGTTVWETFKVYDEVYLPGGQAPPPWSDNTLLASRARARGLKLFTSKAAVLPAPRLLRSTSKVARPLTEEESTQLKSVEQVGNGVLYDQANQPVYYEMLMNQASFDYVVSHQLYNANTQNAYAASTGIVLPPGSIEVKAAWKVLTAAELSAQPRRFHTTQAVLDNSKQPVTVGLVGLHVFQMPSSAFNQGFWATFQQVDNAPLQTGAQQESYSFNNPTCSNCSVNDRATKPTQVIQMFPATSDAAAVNSYMQQLIRQSAPDSPWQFYQLINVQWPTSPQPFGQPGQLNNQTPIPNGSPSTTTLMNPVLETFMQKPGVSCLSCHAYAGVASAGAGKQVPLQSSLSFLFGHASAPASGVSAKRVMPPGLAASAMR